MWVKLKVVFQWPLEPQMVVSYWSSVDAMSLSCTIAEILSLKNNWVTSLTLSCHVMSSVKWPLEPQMVLSYWWSVDAKSLSRMVAEILSVKYNWLTTLTPTNSILVFVPQTTMQSFIEIGPKLRPQEWRQTQTDASDFIICPMLCYGNGTDKKH